ncbi:MAG: carboxypeptidase-like regulatory domain-containing protein [Bryobacteraceae bacterium]|nr:carboxypeptidase-like regulatory domain-containing protein [Bryobacteraceae bacterium]
MRKLDLVVGLLWIALCALRAQTGGQITGEVKDQSGATLPDAVVTVTNSATNVARTTATNSAGLYSFPALTPGVYQVKVVAPGFQSAVTNDIQLQVQQTARIDFSLAVGQATQTLEVAANAAALTTDNATVGTVIEEARIKDLPLNGRSFFSLVALSPNVTFGFVPAAQAAGRLGGSRGALTIAISGGRSTWQNFTLDGITNTDINFNTYILQPSVDALQEFKVQTGIYPAEFGRATGQINVSTKPGTNEYHGTLFEFLRNDKLDARTYDFASSTRSATNPSPGKAAYRQNQYGYTLGGPVVIPKLYNGRNRLFFMSNFEGYNSRLTSPSLGTVLTDPMRAGDFSSMLPAFALADPTSRTGTYPNITQTRFPNNQIPVSRLSRGSLTLLKWMPSPNQPTPPGLPFRNYQYANKTPVDKNTLTQRIDFNESAKSQWFGRFSYNDESTLAVLPTLGLNDGNTLYTRASQWVLSNVRTISATKVNEARFGYNSLFNNITQQLAGVEDVSGAIGVPVKVTDSNSWGVPNISLAQNLTSFGNPTSSPFQINNKYYQLIDNFSWVIGRHSLRMGGEFRMNQFPQLGNEFPRGQFLFNGQFTNTITPTGATTATQAGGYTGADFLLGHPNNSIIAVALASAEFRNHEWATYFDDTWRLSPRLTVTMGLRWEVMQPLLDKSGREVNVQLNQPLPNEANVKDLSKHPVYVRTGSGNFYDDVQFRYAPYWATPNIGSAPVGGLPPLQTVRDGRLGRRLINTNYRNFAPRLGIAYSPSAAWSIRAGVGIFYSEESKNSVFDFNRGLGGRTGQLTPTTYGLPSFSYNNFIDTSSLPVTLPIGLTWGGNSHLPNTSTIQYTLNIQRTLAKSTVLETGYIGSQSRHLYYLANQNQGILNPSLPVVQRLPYPEWGASGIQWINADANGSYNALSGKLTQRFGASLNALVSYTWSRSIDATSNIRGTVGSTFSPQDARCPVRCEKGPSDFNIPHRLVASVLYTLPFGKGHRFLNRGGVVNQLASNWQLGTISTLQSGSAVNTSAWDSGGTNFVSNATRLNCVPGVSPLLPGNNQNGWFNPAAFSNPVAGVFGNCGRNALRGPWMGNQDLSVHKLFPLTERRNIEFRMEMFNAPNHVLLTAGGQVAWNNGSSPNAASTFGKLTGLSSPMRQIQFALKFNF